MREEMLTMKWQQFHYYFKGTDLAKLTSWETHSFCTGQICLQFRNLKISFRGRKSTPLCTILSQYDTIQSTLSCRISFIHFLILSPISHRYPVNFLPSPSQSLICSYLTFYCNFDLYRRFQTFKICHTFEGLLLACVAWFCYEFLWHDMLHLLLYEVPKIIL